MLLITETSALMHDLVFTLHLKFLMIELFLSKLNFQILLMMFSSEVKGNWLGTEDMDIFGDHTLLWSCLPCHFVTPLSCLYICPVSLQQQSIIEVQAVSRQQSAGLLCR